MGLDSDNLHLRPSPRSKHDINDQLCSFEPRDRNARVIRSAYQWARDLAGPKAQFANSRNRLCVSMHVFGFQKMANRLILLEYRPSLGSAITSKHFQSPTRPFSRLKGTIFQAQVPSAA